MSLRRSRRRTGRPTLLTPETTEHLATVLRLGVPQEVAARYVGIGPSTLRRWLATGRDEQERVADGEDPDPDTAAHLELLRVVEHARAEAIVRAVAQVQAAAARGQWRAAAWWLERQCPEEFGRQRSGYRAPVVEQGPPDRSTVDCHDLAERVTRNMAAVRDAWGPGGPPEAIGRPA